MDTKYQVKQFIGKIQLPSGSMFYAFTCGDPRWLLFAQLDPNGFVTGLQIPQLKKNLIRNWRKFITP